MTGRCKPARGIGAAVAPIVTLAAMLSACVTTEPYPQGWAPLPDEAPEDCSIPDGLYANRAADAHRNYPLGRHLSFDGGAEFIRFRSDERGTVTLAAVRYGEVIAQQTLASDTAQVRCKAGWLLFDTSGWIANPAGAGIQSKVLGMLFANGYLVVKRRDSFAGWAYILPAMGSSESWYRYEWLGEVDLRQMQEEILERNKQAKPYH